MNNEEVVNEDEPLIISDLRTREITKGQGDDEWKLVRQNLITASRVAAILGLNKYQNANTILLEMLGLSTMQKRTQQCEDAIQHGVLYEPYALEDFAKQSGKKLFKLGAVRHPQYDCFAASPDSITEDGELVETKCPLTRQIIPNEMPDYYIPQCLFSLEVMDKADCAYFVEHIPPKFPGDEPIRNIVKVQRNPQWFAENVPKLLSFYDRLCFYREHLSSDVNKCFDWDKKNGWKPPTLASLQKDTILRKRKEKPGYLELSDKDFPPSKKNNTTNGTIFLSDSNNTSTSTTSGDNQTSNSSTTSERMANEI